MVIKPSLLGWLLSWAFSINKNSNKQLPLANFTFEQPLPIVTCKCTNSVRTALVTSANVVANIQGRWVWKQAWYFWPCLRVCAKYINIWSGWAGAGVGEIVRVFVCARLRCTCMRASGCERERERGRKKEKKKEKKKLAKVGEKQFPSSNKALVLIHSFALCDPFFTTFHKLLTDKRDLDTRAMLPGWQLNTAHRQVSGSINLGTALYAHFSLQSVQTSIHLVSGSCAPLLHATPP